MKYPVILSIATLRAVNDRIPIYVIDLEDKSTQKWGKFPFLLNFEIRTNYSKEDSNYSTLMNFSKNSIENKIIYCESDILWLRNPLPFDSPITKFHRTSNKGFFAFNREFGGLSCIKPDEQVVNLNDYWNFTNFRDVDLNKVADCSRNYHFSSNWGDKKGLFSLIIKEFYLKLKSVLPYNELTFIFGNYMKLAGSYNFNQLRKVNSIFVKKPKVF